MDWMTDQKSLDVMRKDFLKSESGSLMYQLEMRYLLHNQLCLETASKRVHELMRKGELDVDTLLLFMIGKTSFALEGIVIILREDGYVYFGRSQSTAALGICGRFKDGRVEFYDDYKNDLKKLGTANSK